jgi:hypothetical protein
VEHPPDGRDRLHRQAVAPEVPGDGGGPRVEPPGDEARPQRDDPLPQPAGDGVRAGARPPGPGLDLRCNSNAVRWHLWVMITGSMAIEADAAQAMIAGAVGGDEVAFARIVAAHHEDMARIAYLVSGSLDVADDAVQAAWVIAWGRLGTLRDPARLRPWLMSVAANEARQMTRGDRRRTVRELRLDAPGATPTSPERAALIDPKDRVLIGLR